MCRSERALNNQSMILNPLTELARRLLWRADRATIPTSILQLQSGKVRNESGHLEYTVDARDYRSISDFIPENEQKTGTYIDGHGAHRGRCGHCKDHALFYDVVFVQLGRGYK